VDSDMILSAIEHRISVRGYADREVEPRVLERLLGSANALALGSGHLTAVPPRIALVSGAQRVRRVLTFIIGSYGLVQNPPHLLVGLLPEESDLARLDLGYVLEQVVLEATACGLGSVWIAGSFDARRAGAIVGLCPGEVVAAVCALGYAAEQGVRAFHSRTVRQLAGGHRRRRLEELVFDAAWGQPWSPAQADARLVRILEHARLAPSAVNRQPWRFIVRENEIALALVQRAPLDAGIVMKHVALAAQAVGWGGRWRLGLGDPNLARAYGLPTHAIPVGVFTQGGAGDVP
jgi:nitroreductase